MQCASCRMTLMVCSVPPAGAPPPDEPPPDEPPSDEPLPCGPLDPAAVHAAAPPAMQMLIRISAIVRFIGPPFNRASPTLQPPLRRNIPRQRESVHPARGTRGPRQGDC